MAKPKPITIDIECSVTGTPEAVEVLNVCGGPPSASKPGWVIIDDGGGAERGTAQGYVRAPTSLLNRLLGDPSPDAPTAVTDRRSGKARDRVTSASDDLVFSVHSVERLVEALHLLIGSAADRASGEALRDLRSKHQTLADAFRDLHGLVDREHADLEANVAAARSLLAGAVDHLHGLLADADRRYRRSNTAPAEAMVDAQAFLDSIGEAYPR